MSAPLTRAAIVAEARSWLGTPYRHQASLKGVGCDCLGLVRGVWRALLGDEPEVAPNYTPDWAEAHGSETLAAAAGRHLVAVPIGEAAAGDVLLFRWRRTLPAKHAGILLSSLSGLRPSSPLVDANTFIHAQSGAAVATAPLSNWWRRRIAFAFRLPGVID